MISTIGLAELSSPPVRRVRERERSVGRAHEWRGVECTGCGMRRHWAGARYGCTAVYGQCTRVDAAGKRCPRRTENGQTVCQAHGRKL